jgi:hypothetical protein
LAENDRSELNRREFLRKAAITGAVAWAVPVIQSVAANPAYAQTTPGCFHSLGGETGQGCMGACQASNGCGPACSTQCNTLCPVNPPANNRPCTNPKACKRACWVDCVFTPSAPGC